ncbi:MAG: carbohydrate ABC transporter substrate-binding protein [Ruminococcaceae bacterium]|nr:carbohydrate ABC transporter substrate-binding protein [Oscillospiraceae bacterium]
MKSLFSAGRNRAAALLLLCCLLTGCGGNPAAADSTGESNPDETEPVSTELTADLPDVNYGGYTFTIAFRDQGGYDWMGDIKADEQNGDVVNDAKFNRNRAVEEQLGITIEPYLMSGDAYGNSAVASIMADDTEYDLIAPHAHIAWGTYISQGLALNWSNHMTYCDFDKPWWDQDSRKSLSVEESIYTMAGDFSYYAFAYTRALVFNKSILTDLGEDMPYQAVLDGKWTFDEFNRLCQTSINDLNGDSSFDLGNDRYGYVTNWWGGPIAFLYAGGGRTSGKDANDIPYFTLGDERSVDIYEKFFSIMNTNGMQTVMSSSTEEATKAFTDGQLLFTDMPLFNMEILRSMQDDWGILPLPKLDEEQDNYGSIVDAGVQLYIVPVNSENPERTSAVLEAMSYEGWKTVIPAFYETALQGKYARDDESVQMLDIIKNSRVFDFGYFTCYEDKLHTIGCAGNYLVKETSQDLMSYCEKNMPAAEAELENFIAQIKETN